MHKCIWKDIFMNKDRNLTVLKNLLRDPVIYCLLHQSEEGKSAFLGEVYAKGAERDFLGFLSGKIIRDTNIFSVSLAKGEHVSSYVEDAFFNDVDMLIELAYTVHEAGGFDLGEPKYGLGLGTRDMESLTSYYKKHGYGIFIGHKAFIFEDGNLIPLENTQKTTLSMLKNYEEEKKEILFNMESFLNNLPYNHMLLYGDRGTGKSSTVQAVLNEYYKQGLRLIQIDKKYLDRLDEIKRMLYSNPLKFLLFIDDLSLSHDNDMLSSFKASLEGTLEESDNCMIVATSNRRHIIKETVTDRENDIHPDDTKQDLISLSDRFGLTVLFSTTGKAEYISIVEQIAQELSLTIPDLENKAERWALYKGGRSPRTARQFCSYVNACVMSGKDMEF